MSLDNKIQHFTDVSIDSAEKQRDTVLEEYKKGLLDLFETHKKEAEKNAILQEKLESEDLKRSAYKAIQKESLEIKRKISLKQKEYTDKIFEEVLELLAEYKKTESYKELLLTQIDKALNVSKKDEVVIYIDLNDEPLFKELSTKSKADLTLSKYSFLGGIRAVIPSKNILIDNSFESKFADAKEKFKLTF